MREVCETALYIYLENDIEPDQSFFYSLPPSSMDGKKKGHIKVCSCLVFGGDER